jgi:hypothetical protein
MMRFRLSTLLIVVGVSAAIAAYLSHRYRIAAESLTSLTVNGNSYADGREVYIQIAGNALGRPSVVLIQHHTTPDPKRVTPDLRSELQLKLHYPPDPSHSGLWIDGQELRIGDGLHVLYVSDLTDAENIEIPPARSASFLSDAASLDPLQFVDKWIEPSRGRTKR